MRPGADGKDRQTVRAKQQDWGVWLNGHNPYSLGNFPLKKNHDPACHGPRFLHTTTIQGFKIDDMPTVFEVIRQVFADSSIRITLGREENRYQSLLHISPQVEPIHPAESTRPVAAVQGNPATFA